jgi:hypothetical protein
MSKHTAKMMVAVTERQYQRCMEYVEAKGEGMPNCTFPTVYLEDDAGLIVGVMATQPHDRYVICNKATADSGFRMIQLIDAYELVLARNNIVGYLLPVPKNKPEWKRLVELGLNVTPWGEDGEHYWYTRVIGNGGPACQTLQ